MTDDLKHLKDMMNAATPEPAEKDAHIALAMKNFDDLQNSRQGSADGARHTSDGSTIWSNASSGVFRMLQSLTTRGALTVTTSIAAVGIGIFFFAQNGMVPGTAVPDVVYPDQAPVSGTAAAGGDTLKDEETIDVIAGAPEAPVRPIPAKPVPAAAPNEIAPVQQVRERAAGEAEIAMGEAAPAPASEMVADGFVGGVYAEAPTTAPGFSSGTAQLRKLDPGLLGGALGIADDAVTPPEPDTEAFANEAANPVKITSDDPVSTFSIDVDTAAYSVMRSSLMNGYLPNAASVRVEEMINYFPYDYPAPDAGEAPFKPTVTVIPSPWNAGTQLVHIGIQGMMPALEDRPPLNLVFLIDTSGSMEAQNKLPLLIQSFKLMLSELRPEDEVAIVAYAGSSGQVLEPTPASNRLKIMSALLRLSAGGSTAGQAGLQQAYAVAAEMAKEGEVSRVILATDGDFNVGIYDPDELKDFIAKKRDSGTYLSVLGFGRGNLDDATMQALAQNGNGTAAYIDTLSEAQKVLVDQLSGALFPIANDVKIQVEFNPAQIAEYRLIGYETRALAREDFNNDAVDAGEIGAGHTVTAIYEITPVGSDAVLNNALRYQTPVASDGSGELGFLKLRYKLPGENTSTLLSTPVFEGMGQATDDIRFSVAIAGYGQLLSDSKYLNGWSYEDAIALANETKGDDAFGYRSEAIKLMRLANTLSN
jgi:Ca-activated chloride channel family protein